MDRINDPVPMAVASGASTTTAYVNPKMIGYLDVPIARTAKWKPEKGALSIRKRSRNRAPACDECKRRKIKCDLARPSCTKCATSELLCVWKGRGKAGYVANTDGMVSSLPPNSVVCPNCSVAMTLVPAVALVPAITLTPAPPVIAPVEELRDSELFLAYCN
jgi:hypothetical protein